MDSEPDLDDAIAAILAGSDEDDGSSKKKKTSSSKKRGAHNKSTTKSLNSKALTSSVTDEDFYKNLSKISEEPSKDERMDEVVVTEEDAKKMASDLAGLDDLDSDLLGSLGRKTSTARTKDQDSEKHKDLKRKSSAGSMHRKGSVTPVIDGEGDVFSEDDSEDALNSSMNSTRSRNRKTGASKKSPNKISPRVSFEDAEKEAKTKTTEQPKTSKSKEINFDSDSDLPGLDNHEPATNKGKKKTPAKRGKGKKEKNDDLFGDDDDLPDLDGQPEKRASSALDNLMGSKTKTAEVKKKPPGSLDEFMAKVSTSKTSVKPEVRSPTQSPTSDETFQFGGYMPSAVSGRRSQSSRPETPSETSGRRSVKFSDDLGLDDEMFGVKKRPSTAPTGRKKKDEVGSNDPLSTSLTRQASRNTKKDNSDWLGLDNKHQEKKGHNLSPQTSLEGSKSSASGDWLGLGDDVTDEQLNASLTSNLTREKSPERVSRTSSPRQQVQEKTKDVELSKMLDMVPDENKNSTTTEDKSLFPWEGGKSSTRHRRRPESEQSLKQDSQPQDVTPTSKQPQSDAGIGKLSENIDSGTSSPQITAEIPAGSNQTAQSPGGPAVSSPAMLTNSQRPPPVRAPSGGTPTMTQPRTVENQQGSGEGWGMVVDTKGAQLSSGYQYGLDKQRYEMEVDLKGMRDKIQEVENGKYKLEFELTNKIAELETKIRRLEVENESLVQTLELTKQRHKDEITALENSHKVRVQAVEESYQRREARQKDDTEELITKHKETIRMMEAEKAELQASNARKISAFESSKLNEIERLNDVHRRALEELRSEHSLEMNHLKKMKEQEVSATVTAYSHTKSLQTLMEQVLNSTKQVEDLHHLVDVSHKTNQEERDITAKAKDDYLNHLHDRLLKQQTENDEERNRLQNLVAKMEVHVREQNRRLEEDKWKLSQEEGRLKSMRVSLEEERKMTREQLEAERVLVDKTKEEFLSQQRRLMIELNEERRTISLERSELTAAQRGMINTERHKQNTFTKMDVEQESARIRLEEDLIIFKTKEAQLKKEQEELRREKQEFMEKKEKWDKEKDHIGKMGLELEKRSQEIEDISLEAARVREEGTKSLETAQQMQFEISKQANQLESKVLLLQEKERQIAAERLGLVKEKRESETEKRRGLCSRCSQPQFSHGTDSNGKWEASSRMFSPISSPLTTYKSGAEVVASPSPTTVGPLTPDLLVNTLELKRTLRRWSQDKEQDEEFLAKESEFLNSLGNSRQSIRAQSSATS